MYNIGLIGAGQLGSRHLQGLLKISSSQNIFVLDPSNESLQIAAERAKEIEHEHTVNYCSEWKQLPQVFDLVIVSTGANVRQQVVMELLKNFQVKYLVLEKVLFQDLNAYLQVSDLLDKYKVPTWVNHPRRMFSHYQEIKKQLHVDKGTHIFSAVGSNWGLGCNALHLIDVFTYLADASVTSLDVDWIDNVILESKRVGYVEFTGSIKGRMSNGSTFQITSLQGAPGAITVNVSNSNNRWIVQEGGTSQVIHLAGNENFKMHITPIQMEFQSSLTTCLALSLLETGDCDLPDYQEAQQSHKIFIDKLLSKYILLSGIQTKLCPIT